MGKKQREEVKKIFNRYCYLFKIIRFAMTTLPMNASLLVMDPLEERRRKKRARTAAWRKHSRKLKQAAAGTQNFDTILLFELVPYT